MIISQVIGGLGNQMFQYAAGRSLSLKKNTTLALDVSGFEGYGLHQGFELDRVFSASITLASEADRKRLLGWRRSPQVRRVLARLPATIAADSHFAQEPHFQYWPALEGFGPDSYLAGYWQSEKYFANVASQIRADFTFRDLLDGRNAELSAEIGSTQSVSLHVRRGDYANNPKTKSTHGLCSLDYYREAIGRIAAVVPKPVFFIFSDDIAWVKANLSLTFAHRFVEHNKGAASYNDMRLMSLCQHHVIANSSFSWWGAWLNPSTDKAVVAPRKWFADTRLVQDLFPTDWVLL
jgi:hypothetical protein